MEMKSNLIEKMNKMTTFELQMLPIKINNMIAIKLNVWRFNKEIGVFSDIISLLNLEYHLSLNFLKY